MKVVGTLVVLGVVFVSFPLLGAALVRVLATLSAVAIGALIVGLILFLRSAANLATLVGQLLRTADAGRAPCLSSVNPSPRQRFLAAVARSHWYALERVVAELLRAQGYPVEHRGGAAADGGVDMLIQTAAGPVIVQVKKWEKWKVSLRVVREVLGAKVAAGASGAWLIVTARMTRDARQFADKHGIRLTDLDELADWVESLPDPGPVLAIAEDPVPHCPACRIPMVRRTARRGANRGNEFWGCPNYPACQQSIRTDSKPARVSF